MSEDLTPLPIGWTTARLREIADVQLGKMLDRKRTHGRSLKYLRNINVRWGSIDTSDLFEMPFEDHELDRYSVQRGDVLVCEGGEPGRAAVWLRDDAEMKYQKALHRVRLKGDLPPAWLVHHLFFDVRRGALAKCMTGSTIGHLPREAFVETQILLPPKNEQHRIVAALDSYLSRLDDTVAKLERVQRNLKRYRAAVLQAAVGGRLVPTEAELARAEGRSFEPASELLKCVLAERRRRWEEAELAKLKANGKAPKDDKWKSKYVEPKPPDTSALPELPEGWCWATVEQMYWDADYGTSQKCSTDLVGPPVLRIPNVENERIELDDLKFATNAAELSDDDAVRRADFVFIRTNGSRGLIGRGALVTRDPTQLTFFASYLIRLRLVDVNVLPAWFSPAWHSQSVRNQILADAASSAGQYNVSLGDARRFAIPLPPRSEQSRILAARERVDSIQVELEHVVAQSLTRLSRLRQSILKWAFEGRLVDQDPNDEPAAVLLERIRKERGDCSHGSAGVRRKSSCDRG